MSDISEFADLLSQAKQLVEEHEFHQLIQLKLSEYDTLLDQLSQWDIVIDQKVSLSEQIDLVELEKQVIQMYHNSGREVTEHLLTTRMNLIQLDQAISSMKTQPPSILDKILRKFPHIKYDGISKAIISCFERKKELNIAQLTEAVRKLRGRASRLTIRNRVHHLINQGIIDELDEGHGRQLRLSSNSDN